MRSASLVLLFIVSVGCGPVRDPFLGKWKVSIAGSQRWANGKVDQIAQDIVYVVEESSAEEDRVLLNVENAGAGSCPDIAEVKSLTEAVFIEASCEAGPTTSAPCWDKMTTLTGRMSLTDENKKASFTANGKHVIDRCPDGSSITATWLISGPGTKQ